MATKGQKITGMTFHEDGALRGHGRFHNDPVDAALDVSVSRLVFAAILIAVGAQGFLTGDFNAFWVPGAVVPAHRVLAALCAAVSLAAGIGLLWRGTAAYGVGLLLILLSVWLVLVKAPPIARAPL